MTKRGAFTLVELLVVISIISLLMSILMPALARVRRQAKSVICQAQMKQWGLVFSLYTSDNNGYFMDGSVPQSSGYWWPGGNGGGMGSWWFISLEPYYKDQELRICPMATKTYQSGGQVPFGAWQTTPPPTPPYAGSYGANGYIINSPQDLDFQLGRPTINNWRTINVKGASNIPLFMDALWVDGWPEEYDQPAPVEFWWLDAIGVNEMRRFCCNRHNGFMDGVFADFSVRPIGLKELWTLKWHRSFETNGEWTIAGGVEPTDWPEWMKGFKDY
jgi:prepilin-type N-terminal cleavage/methylation domain-containing protein